MKNTSLFALLVAGGTVVSNLVAQNEPKAEAGFTKIFNGQDLKGWDGNPKLWSVKEGAIIGQTTADNPIKGNTFLIWKDGEVSDFELRFSYRIKANNNANFANSGVQYRSKVLDPANWVVGGYQADMEAGQTYTGILYEERMTRGIMAARGEKVLWDKDCKKQVTGSLGKSEEIQAAIKKEDWNDYVIIAQGNHLQHFVSGKQTVDVTDECESKAAKSGVLALQLHAGQPMSVEFRNLRIKTDSSGKRSANDDLKAVQGAWKVVGVEINGITVPADALDNLLVTITDKAYTFVSPDRTDKGTFTLDPSKQPAQMTIRPETGDDAGSELPAIYEVTSDKMRICHGRPGADRPNAFSAGENSERMLVTYERKKP